jgi:hypothetical protein
MDKSKVKEGQRVTYKTRSAAGTGKITSVTYDDNNSMWVIVFDKDKKVSYKIRPSQVERA